MVSPDTTVLLRPINVIQLQELSHYFTWLTRLTSGIYEAFEALLLLLPRERL